MNKWQFAVYSTSDTLAPAGDKGASVEIAPYSPWRVIPDEQ